jgi:hypothetical protein
MKRVGHGRSLQPARLISHLEFTWLTTVEDWLLESYVILERLTRLLTVL